MKSNRELELTIENIGFEGISISHLDGKAVLLKGNALPGEIVKAIITKEKKNYIEGLVLDVLEPSIHRIEPKCEYFGTCGGCTWQNLDYTQQLLWKRQHVIDAYERIGKLPIDKIQNVIPSKSIYEYRNKMEFSFGTHRWLTPKQIQSNENFNKNFALGMHFPGKFDRIIDIDKCFIQPEIGNQIINLIRNEALNRDITAFNYHKHTGFLKNLVLRYSFWRNSIMAILITNPVENTYEKKFAEWFVNELPNYFKNVKVTYWAINDRQSSVAIGKIQSSNNYSVLQEKILDVIFSISPFSFFQTNSKQLDTFIGKIIEIANLKSDMIIWDLYCGCGSITLPAAKIVKKAIGIEINSSAVNDAIENAKINNITNVEFYEADLHSKKIPSLFKILDKPDLIIVDPPRSGMNDNLVNHLLNIEPKRIVYVSCNPSTQARDIALLSKKYEISVAQPIDMFPHTYHIEVITELIKK